MRVKKNTDNVQSKLYLHRDKQGALCTQVGMTVIHQLFMHVCCSALNLDCPLSALNMNASADYFNIHLDFAKVGCISQVHIHDRYQELELEIQNL